MYISTFSIYRHLNYWAMYFVYNLNSIKKLKACWFLTQDIVLYCFIKKNSYIFHVRIASCFNLEFCRYLEL